MLRLRENETIIRNADGVTIAIDIDIELYKEPVIMYDVLIKEFSTDAEPTVTIQRINWDSSNKLESKRHQYLIPVNKQTDTRPAVSGQEFTDYDSLIGDWREAYMQDSDVIRIRSELIENNRDHDGGVTS